MACTLAELFDEYWLGVVEGDTIGFVMLLPVTDPGVGVGVPLESDDSIVPVDLLFRIFSSLLHLARLFENQTWKLSFATIPRFLKSIRFKISKFLPSSDPTTQYSAGRTNKKINVPVHMSKDEQ